MINSISGGEGTKNSTYYRKLLRGITIGGRGHRGRNNKGNIQPFVAVYYSK